MITIISNSISSIKTGLLIMSARHLLEFITFIKNKNYSQTLSKTDDGGMSIIFIRIFIMQVTIIFGGIIGKIVNNITLGVSLLILLETIYSLYFYNKQFKNQQQYGRTQ
jgi:glucan phosphoethanolaminetransferase (alkaline phosphatase superfamily)